MSGAIKPGGNTERRIYTTSKLELRAAEGQASVLAGYAAVFDSDSEDLGGFVERIKPGAFASSLGGDVRALFNHDSNIILGRTKAKTLTLREDQHGLYVEIIPPDTQAGRDLVESVRRGDVDQMSFGFRTIKDDWEETKPGSWLRTLIEVDVFDVSPVVFPAYRNTEIAVRSLDAWQATNAAPQAADMANELRKLDLLELD